MWPFVPKYFSMFPKHRDILLHNHSYQPVNLTLMQCFSTICIHFSLQYKVKSTIRCIALRLSDSLFSFNLKHVHNLPLSFMTLPFLKNTVPLYLSRTLWVLPGTDPSPISSTVAPLWSTQIIVSQAYFLSFSETKTTTKWKKLTAWWSWARSLPPPSHAPTGT